MKKIFTWILIILAVYTVIGFKIIPMVLENQLVKSLDENLTAKSSVEKIEFNPYKFKAKVLNYELKDKSSILRADELLLDVDLITSINNLNVTIQAIKLKDFVLNIEEDKKGVINLTKLVKPSEKKKDKEEKKSQSDIKFLISKIDLENAKISFQKYNKNKPYRININHINYKIDNLGTYENASAINDLKLKINNSTQVILNGNFKLEPFSMKANAKIKNLKPKEFVEYDQKLFNFTLNKNANLNLNLDIELDLKKDLRLVAQASNININDVNLTQKNTNILKMKRFDIKSLLFDLNKQVISIDSPKINDLKAKVIQNEQGLNFSNLINSMGKEETKKDKIDNKPWQISLKNTNLKNVDLSYNDTLNNLAITSPKTDLSLSKLDINNSVIDLMNISLNTSNLDYIDNKNNLNIKTEDISSKLANLNINDSKITTKQFELKTPKLDFNDLNSLMDINSQDLILNLDTFKLENNNIYINNSKLENSELNYNDNNLKLNIKTADSLVNLDNLKIEDSKINIQNIDTNLGNLFFEQLESKLNIKIDKIKNKTSNINIDNSKIDIENIALQTPNLDLNDEINKLKINIKSNNIDLKKLAIDGSKIGINSIKVQKPDIFLENLKNNILLDAKELQIDIDKLSQENDTLNMDKAELMQTKLSFKDTKENTEVFADNINLIISKFYNSDKLLSVQETILNEPILSVILPKSDGKKKKEKEKKESKSSKKMDLGEIIIKKAQFHFEDKNLPIPFKTHITNLDGKISEYNSTKSAVSKLNVTGTVNKYGTAKIVGNVNPNSIKILSDINMILKNISMDSFTPYSGKFIGREIDSGKLELDLKYNIKNSNLKGDNNIVIKKLKLGAKVESKDAVSLPLETAIALLEDSDNTIDIDLPVGGNVDNPKFSIGSIVWKAFTNLILKAITAPFSLIGAVFGFDENEIKSVNFDKGSFDVNPSQQETLDKISKILTKKKNIIISFSPSYDKQKDIHGLKEHEFTIQINEKLPNKDMENYEDKYIELLESMYKDLGENIDKLKVKYIDGVILDTQAYKKDLENYVSSKIKVKKDTLTKLAHKRVENIYNYLVNTKKINPKQIHVIKEKMNENSSNIKLNIEFSKK